MDSYPSDPFSVDTNHYSQRTTSSGSYYNNDNNNNNNNNNLSPLALAIQTSIDSVFPLLQGSPKDGTAPGDSKKKVIITLSVSGGCDSVAMLHACMEGFGPGSSREAIKTTTTTTMVQVVHFNHQQRGAESDDDATFVQDLCRTYNLPCHVELWRDHENEHPDASLVPTFSQDTAREWRRKRLFQLTQQAMDNMSTRDSDDDDDDDGSDDGSDDGDVGIILTAHHQDDSMESLLLKALRGVHLLNISGMKLVTQLTPFMFLLRPWIQDVSKQDLIEYLLQKNWTWREDPSNASSKYLRNRVRNELIPLLQDMTDQSFVSTRIPTWIQQSQELVQDLQPRIEALSRQVIIRRRRHHGDDAKNGDHDDHDLYFDWGESCALVESTDDLAMTPLVQSQTLYQWMSMTTLHAAGPISYETFQRVLDQLRMYSHNQEWIIELGKGCSIQRQGGMLRIRKPSTTTTDMSNMSTDKRKMPIPWSWSALSQEELDRMQTNSREPVSQNHKLPFRWPTEEIILWISKDWILPPVPYYQTTLAEYEQACQPDRAQSSSTNNKIKNPTSLMFCPPWKTSSTPVKLRQFLRGQGVPPHQRDDTPLLVANHAIVAVQIQQGEQDSSKNEWIVNAEHYCPSCDILHDSNPNDTSNKVPIRLFRNKK